MKKILSSIIVLLFIFQSFWLSVNAFSNFKNLWANKFYYWKIIWELKKSVNWKKSIFLLEERNWTIKQLFSSKLVNTIENLYINKNNIKILWQSYTNPNNHKYAWVFVNKIWNLDKKTTKKTLKIYSYKKISDYQKNIVYYFLVSSKSKNKFIDWKKYFWNIDLKKLYKEMSEKNRHWKTNQDLLSFINYTTTDKEFYSNSKEFKKLEKTERNFQSIDKKILDKINSYWNLKIKKILNSIPLSLSLSDKDKVLFNELKNINWYKNLLERKIQAKKLKFSDFNYQNFSKIINYPTSKQKMKFLFSNEKIFKNIFLSKNKNTKIKDFSEILKWNIILDKIKNNISQEEFYPVNLLLDKWKVKNFLNKNDTEKIKKTAFSKDYQSKFISNIKVNFPQNFNFQELKFSNLSNSEIYSKIYYKDFYSNILSFDFNKVNKFSEQTWKKSYVKIAWNYWVKIVWDKKITYQIINKWRNSEEKFEISYSTEDKNFTKIFEDIINKIWE